MTGFRVPGPSRAVCECGQEIAPPEAMKGAYGLFWRAEHAVTHRAATHRRLTQLGQAPTRTELETLIGEYAVLVEQYEVRDRKRRRDLDDCHDLLEEQRGDILRLHDEIAELRQQVPS